VSGSDDHTVKLWDVLGKKPRLITTFTGHSSSVYSVSISPDNRIIYSAGRDGTIKAWEISSRQCLYTIYMLPGNEYVVIYRDNRFTPSSPAAMNYLYYSDGLARYPAKDLPALKR
jgi:WD40 repeat protein